MAASDHHHHFSPNLLLQSMTSLWFHQNILINKPPRLTTTLGPTSETPPPSSPPSSTVQVNRHTTSDETTTTTATSSAPPKKKNEGGQFVIKHQQLRLKPASSGSLSRSSSLSPGTMKRLRRRVRGSGSCKSLSELEDEELKGFMDLGFSFKEEEVSSHVMKILPGLKKLDRVEEKRPVSRPYLSEAWLISRPDSPLLNLRIPRLSAASMADMKRHLRCWARTVADEIEQES